MLLAVVSHGVCLYLQLMTPVWVWTVIPMLFVITSGDVYARMVSKAMELVARVSSPFYTCRDLQFPIKWQRAQGRAI